MGPEGDLLDILAKLQSNPTICKALNVESSSVLGILEAVRRRTLFDPVPEAPAKPILPTTTPCVEKVAEVERLVERVGEGERVAERDATETALPPPPANEASAVAQQRWPRDK
ncbi:hypothetical protein KIPB_009245, partial [Kipferlia bialata]|eukprot:g9245.t1